MRAPCSARASAPRSEPPGSAFRRSTNARASSDKPPPHPPPQAREGFWLRRTAQLLPCLRGRVGVGLFELSVQARERGFGGGGAGFVGTVRGREEMGRA